MSFARSIPESRSFYWLLHTKNTLSVAPTLAKLIPEGEYALFWGNIPGAKIPLMDNELAQPRPKIYRTFVKAEINELPIPK